MSRISESRRVGGWLALYKSAESIRRYTRLMSEAPQIKPPSVPRSLKDASPSVKLVWAWLKDQGTVSYSVREIADALELNAKNVSDALNKLRETGCLVDIGEHEERKKGTFYIKRS